MSKLDAFSQYFGENAANQKVVFLPEVPIAVRIQGTTAVTDYLVNQANTDVQVNTTAQNETDGTSTAAFDEFEL